MSSLLWLVLLLSWPLYVSGKGECVLKGDDFESVNNILITECTKVTSEYATLTTSPMHEEKFKEWMKIVEHIDVKGIKIEGGSLEKISFPKLRFLRTGDFHLRSNAKLKNLEMEATEILEANGVVIYDNDNLTSLKIKVDELRWDLLYFQENNQLEELDFSGIKKWNMKRRGIIGHNKALKSIKFADEIEELNIHEQLTIHRNPKLTSIKLPLHIKAKENECAPLYIDEFRLNNNSALEDVRFPVDGFQKCSKNGEAIKNVKPMYLFLSDCPIFEGKSIDELRTRFLVTDINGTTSCIPPNPIKNLGRIIQHQLYSFHCNLLIGDVQLAEDVFEEIDACYISEIRGNLMMGKLEVDKFDCLKNVIVKGEISCARPDLISNWEKLKNCTVIEGDLQLTENVTNSDSCSLTEIRGNLGLGKLEMDKCLKNVIVAGEITCIRPNQIKNWEILNRCTVIEGDLKFANKIEGKASCKINNIQGNLVLERLELNKLDCLKEAKVEGEISCIRPNPVESLNRCTLIEGDLQLAENFNSSDSCSLTEIRGNLSLGKLEVDKFDCLKTVTVKGDISCIRPNPVANWEILNRCMIIEGDLKLANKMKGKETRCKINKIRGNLLMQNLEKEKSGCLREAKVEGQIACAPSGPVANLDALKDCQIVAGDFQLAQDFVGSDSCPFSEIQGNLIMGKLEAEKLKCLRNVTVKREITCLRPDPLSNWKKLAHCKVIEGDLKLDGNITGDVSSCSIATIRGNLSLGALEKEKLDCLKITKVARYISCVRSNLVTDWNDLSSCQIIEGDLQMAENIAGNSSCSISEIQGNLILGSLEMERVACLKNATIKGQLSSSNCAFDYSLFPNAKSHAPLLGCQISTITVDPQSAEGQQGGDSSSQNDSDSKEKSNTITIGIFISVVLVVLGVIGIVVFFVLRAKQSKKAERKKESTTAKEISQKNTDLCLSTSTSIQEKNGKKPELKKEEEQQKEGIKSFQQKE